MKRLRAPKGGAEYRLADKSVRFYKGGQFIPKSAVQIDSEDVYRLQPIQAKRKARTVRKMPWWAAKDARETAESMLVEELGGMASDFRTSEAMWRTLAGHPRASDSKILDRRNRMGIEALRQKAETEGEYQFWGLY